jgi:putative ABC transport system permease protein
MFDQLTREIAYSARGLMRDRSFTLTTVATLTVGLSLVTVVFAIFNAYVLRPYAVRDPYSLYQIRWSARDGSHSIAGREFRWSEYEEMRAREDLFDDALAERNRPVSWDGRPLIAAFVSGNYFDMLGGRVMAGRALAGFDARSPGGEPVAVLSHRAWTLLFDADPAIVGRTIRLNDQILTVVGVMQEEFQGLNDTPPDLWVPATMHGPVIKQDLFAASQPRSMTVVARLRRNVSPDQAAAILSPFMQGVAETSGIARAIVFPQATPAPLTVELVAILSPVFAAFALVLVAACANVSNVMLARANARHREIGIRLSLGAGRWRVVRQLVIEGLLIAGLAALAALGVASLALRAGLALFFLTIPSTFAAVARVLPLNVDHRVFLFTATVATLATIVFALLPALQTTRLTLTSALRGELSSGMRGSRLRHVLVISQVAVSLVLIVAAATLVRNGSALQRTDVGFDTTRLVSIRPAGRLLQRAHQTLLTDPHVEHVSVTSHNPLTGELPMAPVRKPQENVIIPVSYMWVSPDYFTTLQLPISRGRGFTSDEARAEARVAIISGSAAQALWPGADPLGKTVRVLIQERRPDVMTRQDLVSSADVASAGEEVEIIGVTADVVSGLVYNGRTPHLYMPTSAGASRAKDLLVRGHSVQDIRTDTLQAILRDVDPNPLSFTILTLDEALALQMYPMVVASWIGLLLSAIALALSVSGLYGVVTYGLSQRTKEIGIRMALGATPSGIVRLVMSQSGRLVAIGAAFGLVVSFSVLGVLAAVIPLENVSIIDAPSFAAGTAILALAAALAAFFPSRRATRIDPSQALRSDA